ncbi:POK8 protein, partial [Dyaphorophyia castanea]|nr:POK8 protein [Platysteira castanea]
PWRHFHWTVLPQGMKNSPAICQWYVAKVLSPVRREADEAIIYHYMDDILICAPNNDALTSALDRSISALTSAGFEINQEKIQRLAPWKYLGLLISEKTISPQKLEILENPETLRDIHQLCGQLQWIRSWVGIPTECLTPLFDLLKGGEDLDAPRPLTSDARQAIQHISTLIAGKQSHRCQPELGFKFIILGKLPHLHGLIFQWDRGEKDPLLIIEWLISKARLHLRALAGCDFTCIHLPIQISTGRFTKEALEQLLRENEMLQFSLDSYTGQILVHAPSHKLFNANFNLAPKELQSRRPLKALTVFTDASGASHKSVLIWRDPQTQRWESDVETVEGSPQVAELAAVVRAFERFPEPVNVVTDSAYVAGVVSRAEHAVLKEVQNPKIFELLSKLIYLLSHREQPFYVMHVRSHTGLPGFIAEGNERADALAAPVQVTCSPNIFERAKLSHQHFHQNAPALVRQFHLRRDQAKAIVATCPRCSKLSAISLGTGVNPRGLSSCEVWQTDVTHCPQFGRLKFVHVSVDTCSGAVFASAHTGERALDAKKHLMHAFAVLGVPKELKTDNGPAYTSRAFQHFLQKWGIRHRTGIPHSPTGQAIIERTHLTLKTVLSRQ